MSTCNRFPSSCVLSIPFVFDTSCVCSTSVADAVAESCVFDPKIASCRSTVEVVLEAVAVVGVVSAAVVTGVVTNTRTSGIANAASCEECVLDSGVGGRSGSCSCSVLVMASAWNLLLSASAINACVFDPNIASCRSTVEVVLEAVAVVGVVSAAVVTGGVTNTRISGVANAASCEECVSDSGVGGRSDSRCSSVLLMSSVWNLLLSASAINEVIFWSCEVIFRS